MSRLQSWSGYEEGGDKKMYPGHPACKQSFYSLRHPTAVSKIGQIILHKFAHTFIFLNKSEFSNKFGYISSILLISRCLY